MAVLFGVSEIAASQDSLDRQLAQDLPVSRCVPRDTHRETGPCPRTWPISTALRILATHSPTPAMISFLTARRFIMAPVEDEEGEGAETRDDETEDDDAELKSRDRTSWPGRRSAWTPMQSRAARIEATRR